MTRPLGTYTKPATGDELYWLIRLVADLALALQQTAQAGLAGTGVSLPMRYLMEMLDDSGPHTAPKLAIGLSVTRQAVQPLVDALVADGRAELLPNAANRRSPLVRLTDEGQAVFDAIRAAEMRHVWRIAARFPRGDIGIARRTVTGLRAAFAEVAAAGKVRAKRQDLA